MSIKLTAWSVVFLDSWAVSVLSIINKISLWGIIFNLTNI